MPIETVAAEVRHGDRLVARGVCHLVVRHGPEGGTISQVDWTGSEPDLTDAVVMLRLADGRTFAARITRHSHPEGTTVLRFRVMA